MAVPAPGVYNLVADAGGNASLVTLRNNHAALLANMVGFIGGTAPMYVYVPAGVTSFTVKLTTPAPGETARLTVLDPEGKEAASGATGAKPDFLARVTVPPAMAGKAWAVVVSPAPPGVLEDLSLELGSELPAYWAQAADRLVTPGL